MNIKLQLEEVRLLIDKRFPIEKICNQLRPLAKQVNLIFAEHQVGAGYLQWTLPGSDWTTFSGGTEEQKAIVAQIYKERKLQMQSLLQGSFLKDLIFYVPSEDYIFFRLNGERYDIALTAWGYKFLDKPASAELDTWISKHELQNVSIAFSWADKLLPGVSFKLSGHMRITSSDGFLHIDGLLPVGNSYQVETLIGHTYTLIVEKGKNEYIFDLTQYYNVEIVVYKDQKPIENCMCEINFGIYHKVLTTNQLGRLQVQLPLLNTPLGEVIVPQSPCVVTCCNETQEQIPCKEGDTLCFTFNFKSKIPTTVIPKTVSHGRHVLVKIEVFRKKEPVEGQTCEILFNGDSHGINTDEKGEAFFDMVLNHTYLKDKSENHSICKVICDGICQSKVIFEDTNNLVFHFDLIPKETPTKEPEYVFIQLKDYAGEPLKDMTFNLTIKRKGCIQLQTDNEGKCKLPKEWFTVNEKMEIDFIVSSEYQRTHDIHYKNKRK